MLVRQFLDPLLAQYAYLVGCPRSGEAIVIDPERDVDRYFEEAARHKLRIVGAADTHIHADYLSGLHEMAARGVTVYASREGGPDWQYEWLTGSTLPHRLLGHGDRFTIGFIEFLAVHTPGHTPEHLSYLVRDAGSGASDFIAIASGDFVFVGDVGRPDLLESAAGVAGAMVPSAKQQYASIRDHFRTLPEFMQVWPGHGAGSACGKSLGDIPTSTVGYELRTNHSVQFASDEATFVDFILAGQPEPPLYFARMKRDNRRGPALLPSMPQPPHLSVAALQAQPQGERPVVLDTRARSLFHAGHLPGSLLADLDFQFCAVAGSFITDDTPLVLVVDEARRDDAVRGLIRVGLDRIVGYVTPGDLAAYADAGGALAQTRRVTMERMEALRLEGGVRILDVRGRAEFETRHVPGALHIAHTRMLEHMDEIPAGVPLVVHCGTGRRAAPVVALLERLGVPVTLVDDAFANYRQADGGPTKEG